MSIAAVERDTGLSKDTLRVWERRYGFPLPDRDKGGERSYPPEQVQRLRAIKRLLEAGQRPGRIVPMTVTDLDRLSRGLKLRGAVAQNAVAPQAPGTPDLADFVAAILHHDIEGLRRAMAATLSRVGLGHFVLDVLAPLNVRVSEARMQGRVEVFEEHLYTECVQAVLRSAVHQLPVAGSGCPRVLLATVPGEPHGLGLLMAEAVLALEGCHCTSLGVQTPVWDIVRAAAALGSDVVALSYTGCTSPQRIADLTETRAKLPAGTAVWAGGSAAALRRRAMPGVHALPRLDDIAPALAEWHRQRALAAC
jgi:methanogenic corrinoid protein MtbC1